MTLGPHPLSQVPISNPSSENSADELFDRDNTFRHTVGTLLADMGEHQLTIRDYLRHSNLSVTNKYLQSTSKTKRLAQEKLVDAILPTGSLSASKSTLIQ